MSWFSKLFRKSAPTGAHSAATEAAAPSDAVRATAPTTASVPVVGAGSDLPRIAVVTGSTRPNRVNRGVAEWVLAQARRRGDASYELLDIADFKLPLLDEAYPAAYQNYQKDHTVSFAARIAEFDGYVFVTPEYNHSVAPALANALSFVNAEFNNKAAGIVAYGSAYGARSVEHLRHVLSELQVAHVQKTGMFSLFTDFEEFSTFRPTEQQAASLAPVLDQLVPWTRSFAAVRAGMLASATA